MLGDHIVPVVMDIQGVTTVLGGRTIFGRKDLVVYRKLLTNIQACSLLFLVNHHLCGGSFTYPSWVISTVDIFFHLVVSVLSPL